MNHQTRYTVIGAGHGGKAMAADLAVRGFAVNLYNRTAERISEIALRGEIELEYEDGRHCLGRQRGFLAGALKEAVSDRRVRQLVQISDQTLDARID